MGFTFFNYLLPATLKGRPLPIHRATVGRIAVVLKSQTGPSRRHCMMGSIDDRLWISVRSKCVPTGNFNYPSQFWINDGVATSLVLKPEPDYRVNDLTACGDPARHFMRLSPLPTTPQSHFY